MPKLKLLFAATALAALAALASAAQARQTPICTDRPTKANATCTAPAGRLQLEGDLFSATRTDLGGGLDAETDVAASFYVKYGLGERTDVQLNWTPYIEARLEGAGVSETVDGVGDVLVRLKHRFYESERASVAVIPFVKVPTASDGLGNGEVEGGVALPINFVLPNSFSLTFGPEIDVLADADGKERHLQYVNLINLARPLNDRVTVIGELWTATNDDPSGSVTQASADVAVTFLATPTLQLDAGANFGLNDETPDTQLYVGVSKRF